MTSAFLCKKRWHVGNYANQKQVAEAERRRDEAAARERARQKEIDEELAVVELVRKTQGDEEAERVRREMQTSFLYEPPPGYTLGDAEKKPKPNTERPKETKAARERNRKIAEDPLAGGVRRFLD